jgi:hypothetical protein
MDDAAAVGVLMVSGTAPPAPEDPTPGIVFGVAVVAAFLAVVTTQYATRSAWRSAAVGVAGLVAAWTIASVWPWPLLQPRLLVPDWAVGAPALALSVDPQSVEFDTENPWPVRTRSWRIGRAPIRLDGIQPGWLPSVRVTGAVLELNSGGHLSSPGVAHAAAASIGGENHPPLRGVIQTALGVGRLAMPDTQDPERSVVLVIRDADFNRHAPGAGAYHGRAVVELTREEVVATLPLQPGARYQDGAYRVVVDDVSTAPPNLGIRARISDARTAFNRRPTPMYAFYLRNQRRSEAVASSVVPLQHNALVARLLPGVFFGPDSSSGFSATEQFIRFPAYAPEKDRFDFDGAWISGAEIVIVRATGEGSVPRALEIRDFPLRVNPR